MFQRMRMTRKPKPGGRGQARLPAVLLLTDAVRRPDPRPAAARLAPGSGIILRHYDVEGRAQLARSLAALARCRRLCLLVAADWRLAAAVGAAGVHLPEWMLRSGRLAPLRLWARRRGRLLTAACHGGRALAEAARINADAAILSPVFPTASHPDAAAIGPVRFAGWVRRARLPVYALGGVSAATIRHLNGSGAVGIAGVSGMS